MKLVLKRTIFSLAALSVILCIAIIVVKVIGVTSTLEHAIEVREDSLVVRFQAIGEPTPYYWDAAILEKSIDSIDSQTMISKKLSSLKHEYSFRVNYLSHGYSNNYDSNIQIPLPKELDLRENECLYILVGRNYDNDIEVREVYKLNDQVVEEIMHYYRGKTCSDS